jgi:archaeal flagellar protein FlaJ
LSEKLKKYQLYLNTLKIKIPAKMWILLIIIISFILGLLGFIIDIKIGILLLVNSLVLGLGMPMYLYYKKIRDIEKYWPDALKLIADTMKSGSSLDFSLREVAVSDFGPLSVEINNAIRRLEMGDTMYVALGYLSLKIDSKIVRRTITLIQEALRTGAQLADVLEEIANDTKQLFRVKKERQTRTMLQTIFIVAASAIVAPFIFGMAKVIAGFLTDIATNAGIGTVESTMIAVDTQKTIFLLLDIYIVIEIFAASAMISMMREGDLSFIVLFFPVLVTIGYIVYFIAQFALNSMLAGMV